MEYWDWPFHAFSCPSSVRVERQRGSGRSSSLPKSGPRFGILSPLIVHRLHRQHRLPARLLDWRLGLSRFCLLAPRDGPFYSTNRKLCCYKSQRMRRQWSVRGGAEAAWSSPRPRAHRCQFCSFDFCHWKKNNNWINCDFTWTRRPSYEFFHYRFVHRRSRLPWHRRKLLLPAVWPWFHRPKKQIRS